MPPPEATASDSSPSFSALAKRTGAFLALYAVIAFAAVRLELLDRVLLAPSWLAVSAGLAVTLAILSAYDLATFRLPDLLTLPLIAAGIAVGFVLTGPDPLQRLLAAVAAFALLAGVAYLYERLRGYGGLGLGDAKLFAAAGSWTALELLPHILFVAAATAILAAGASAVRAGGFDPRQRIAFGPYIAFAFWCGWLFAA